MSGRESGRDALGIPFGQQDTDEPDGMRDGESDLGTDHGAARLAAIVFPSRFRIDALMSEVAQAAIADGARLAGVVQARVEDPATGRSNLMLRGLRGDWELPILEERGQAAKGCRLDPQAVTDAAGRLQAELARGVDLLIVNRFGRAESEGYGLRNVLGQAAEEGVPTLVGVREDYVEAWDAFHGGLGITLPLDAAAALRWYRGVARPKAAARPAAQPA